MPYDYAPRLALLARARKRRHTWFTVCLLALPALSFQTAGGAPDAALVTSMQLAQTNR